MLSCSCFEKTGVKIGDERDQLGRPRFFPFSPQAWFNPRGDVYKSADWFKHYSVHHYKMVLDHNCTYDYLSIDSTNLYFREQTVVAILRYHFITYLRTICMSTTFFCIT